MARVVKSRSQSTPRERYRTSLSREQMSLWFAGYPKTPGCDVRFGSRLCENSDVELARRISVSISSLSNPIAPATSLGRKQLRKQFCASLAQASFTQPGSNSEVELADADFRFTPQSRHPAGGLACPKSAKSGPEQMQQTTVLFDHLVGAGEQ